MPRVRVIDFKKKSMFTKIKEVMYNPKIPHPKGMLVDANIAHKGNADLLANNMRHMNAQNNIDNLTKNFQNKTAGLSGKIGIAHGPTKDTSNYPNQKNGVYEKIPDVKDYFRENHK